MIVAGIGSRKGVSADEVNAAIDAALAAHGLERCTIDALATTDFKRGEAGIFEAGAILGLPVKIIALAQLPYQSERTLTRSALSLSVAGSPSVCESAALAAAGPGATLLGARIVTGRVTCALAEAHP